MQQLDMVEPATAQDPPAHETATEVVDRADVRDGQIIVSFSRTRAALAELQVKYGGAVPDVKTKDGMAQAKVARAALRALRIALEDKRKEFKKPALDFGRRIDEEARSVDGEIRKIEDPYSKAIDAEEARLEEERVAKARAEAERVREHEAQVDMIEQTAHRYLAQPSTVISQVIATMSDPGYLALRKWDEYEPAAREALRVTLEQLQQHLANAKAREELAALRAQQEQERLARETAEREEREAREREQHRVDSIKDRIKAIELAPGVCIGMPSSGIAKRLQDIRAEQAEGLEPFAEFAEEARLAMESTIRQLENMHADATQAEHDAAQRAIEQQELQRLRDAETQRQREEQAERDRQEQQRLALERAQREAQARAAQRIADNAGALLEALKESLSAMRTAELLIGENGDVPAQLLNAIASAKEAIAAVEAAEVDA